MRFISISAFFALPNALAASKAPDASVRGSVWKELPAVEHIEKRDVFNTRNAGAAFTRPPATTLPMTSITATVTGTSPTPAGGSKQGDVVGSIGIDLLTCASGYVYAGLFYITEATFTTAGYIPRVYGVFQWKGGNRISMANFADIKAGERVAISLHADTPSTAAIVMRNLNSGQVASTTISAPSSTQTLCGLDAGWLVQKDESVPVTNWTTINFSGGVVTDLYNNNYAATNRTTLYQMQNSNGNGQTIGSATLNTGSNVVAVKYTGPS